ncbi:MAG: hypothetical protein Q9177_006796, partial [Variospora cf. flavescens]
MHSQTLVVTLALGAAALASPVNLAPRDVVGDALKEALKEGFLNAAPDIIGSAADFTTSNIGSTGPE